jgi:predicted MFS family arabinose efflux permease
VTDLSENDMSVTTPSPVGRPEFAADEKAISSWLTLLLAASCGLIVANLYYAQPLVGPISNDLGLPRRAAGLIVTLTQIGYSAGLLLIVPLGDLIENRRLVLILVAISGMGLLAAGLASHPAQFLVAALITGISSVSVQVLVPYASHMAPAASRGRVVGNVMSGLMLGIMLARPISSFITQVSSWHVVYFISASLMVLLGTVLAIALPKRVHPSKLGYGELLSSMVVLAATTPVLRRRALYQACLFGAFSLFWTTVPLLLAGPAYRLSQGGIALFALAGVAGAFASPIAGRVADSGWTRQATVFAMMCVAVAFLVIHFLRQGSPISLGLLVLSAITLDFGVSANLTLGQRAIFVLGAEYRARLNGLYMTTFILGGAICSAIGGWTFAVGGWSLTSWVGFGLPVVALLYFSTEKS